jgi:hypothetical protein
MAGDPKALKLIVSELKLVQVPLQALFAAKAMP